VFPPWPVEPRWFLSSHCGEGREKVHDHEPTDITQPSAVTNGRNSDALPLTRREVEILRLVSGGRSNREVARMLWVTDQTVKFHLANVYKKLGVSGRAEAARWAWANGLLTPEDGEPSRVVEGRT
jgi:DNA-binding CsgD family transcriptional regulator